MNINKHYKTLGLDNILNKLSDKTSCSDSKKKVLEIIPSHNFEVVCNLLKETSDAHMLITRFKVPSFNGLHDIKLSVKRAEAGSTLSMLELLKIADTIHVFNSIEKFREQSLSVKTSLDVRFNQITPNKYLENKIKSCILSEDEISDTASPELSNIRCKIKKISDNIRDQLNKMLRSPNLQKYLQENIVTIKSGRFVLPVRSEFRKEVAGLVHDTSSSGATIFIEPMSIVDANNEIKVLYQQEKNEIDKILKDLSTEVARFSEDILVSYNMCVELDIIFAKADLAYNMKAVLPRINKQGKINLKNARHPLIDKEKVVPIDISLGVDFDTLVITGPNTGGKTVSLKTIGLLTLMAMCGLMIPADEGSEVSIFDYVLSDIGDEQSIEQSLSTFSSHMVNIIDILKYANTKSLILLDELGSGTDPVEGAALAISILEKLKENGCKIVATTHYTDLKSYALSAVGVENGCCEFDVTTLKPTYKLLVGVPGRSNAFAISERLGMPLDILNKAKSFISDENIEFESIIKNLEDSRTQLEKEKAEIEELKEQIKKDSLKLSEEKIKIKNKCDLEIKNAKIKSENIVARARAMADELMDEIKKVRKLGFDSDSTRKIKSHLNKIEKTVNPIEKRENSNYELPRKLKIGDSVLIFDIDKKGIVVDINNENNEVTVQAGIIKTKVPINNIRLLEEEKKKKISSINGRNLKNIMRPVEQELDVRGKTSSEAIMDIDKFIDNALLSNINQLTIIHGKGTGVLRAEITKHLKKHPNIETFRLGRFGEGESGVTIVELK